MGRRRLDRRSDRTDDLRHVQLALDQFVEWHGRPADRPERVPDRADRPEQSGCRGRDHRLPAVRVGRQDALAAGRPGDRQEPDGGAVRSHRASERGAHGSRRGMAADQHAGRYPLAGFVRALRRASLLPGVRTGRLARVHGDGQPGDHQRTQAGSVFQSRRRPLRQHGQRECVEPAHVASTQRDAVRQRGVCAGRRAQLPGIGVHHLLRRSGRPRWRRVRVRQVRPERAHDVHRRSGRQLVAGGVRPVGGPAGRRIVQTGGRHRGADAEHRLPAIHLAAAYLDQHLPGRERQRHPRCRRAADRAGSEPGAVPQRQVQQLVVLGRQWQRELRRDVPAVQLVRGRVRYDALPRDRSARRQRRGRTDRRARADGQRPHRGIPGAAGDVHQGHADGGLHRKLPAARCAQVPRVVLLLQRRLLRARGRRRPAAGRWSRRLDRPDRSGHGPLGGRARLRQPVPDPRLGQDAVRPRRERRHPRARGLFVHAAVR